MHKDKTIFGKMKLSLACSQRLRVGLFLFFCFVRVLSAEIVSYVDPVSSGLKYRCYVDSCSGNVVSADSTVCAVNDTCRPKVAVVLSGGGAKGMAHIGALRVLERAGIPIDIITGTSMGALIGGLYSIGYDAETLDSLVSVQDWNVLLTDKIDMRSQSLEEREKQNTYILSRPLAIKRNKRDIHNAAGGLINGINLSQLFTRLTVGWHDSVDFADLPIPFACVATNIVDNTEYDFYGGHLSTAMRASMAIPGVFTPVRMLGRVDSLQCVVVRDSRMQDNSCWLRDSFVSGDKKYSDNEDLLLVINDSLGLQEKEMVLVDGGLRNNYPADLAKRLGADIIIGVSVQSDPRTANELKSGSDILMQIVDMNCKNKFEENWAMTDVRIKVDVKGYSSASFSKVAIDTLIARGEQAAMSHWDELVGVRNRLGLPDGYRHNRVRRFVPSSEALCFRIDSVVFDPVFDIGRDYIVSKYGIRQGQTVQVKQIEEAISALSSIFLYTGAGYNLSKEDGKYILKMFAEGRKTVKVNLGVRFDTEEMVALQVNMSHRLRTKTPIELEFTGRLGKRMMARVDAGFIPLHYGKMGLSYILRHHDISIFENGDKAYNFTYNRNTLNLQAISFSIRNFSCGISLCTDFYNFHNVLVGSRTVNERLDDLHVYSYMFSLNYDSEDRWFFTRRGARAHISYRYCTDNFVGWNGNAGISVADFMWRMSFPAGSRFVFQPMLCGRFLFGSRIPLIMRNAVGGQMPGQYIEQQLPFAGIGHIEFIDNSLFALQLRAQQRMGRANYIIARMSLGQSADKFKRIFERGPIFGCEAAYYYDSMFGPIGAALGYSGHTDKPYFYVNLGFDF